MTHCTLIYKNCIGGYIMKKHKLLNVQLLLLTVLLLFALTGCKKQNDTEEVTNTPNNLSDLINEDEPTQTVVVDLPIADAVTGEETESSEGLDAIIKESYELVEESTESVEENTELTEESTEPSTELSTETAGPVYKKYITNAEGGEPVVYQYKEGNYYMNNAVVQLNNYVIDNYSVKEIMNFLAFIYRDKSVNADYFGINSSTDRPVYNKFPVTVESTAAGGSVLKFENNDLNYYVLTFIRNDATSWVALYNSNKVYALMPSEEANTSAYEKQNIEETLRKSSGTDLAITLVYPVPSGDGTAPTYWITCDGNFTLGSNSNYYKTTVRSFNSLKDVQTIVE